MNKAIMRLFTTAFNEKSVLNDVEFYQKIHHISKDTSNEMIKDLEQLGMIEVVWKKGTAWRIYQKDKLI